MGKKCYISEAMVDGKRTPPLTLSPSSVVRARYIRVTQGKVTREVNDLDTLRFMMLLLKVHCHSHHREPRAQYRP